MRLLFWSVQQRLNTHVATMSNIQAHIFTLRPEIDPETHRVQLTFMPSRLSTVYTYNCPGTRTGQQELQDELLRRATAKNYMVFTLKTNQGEPDEAKENEQ